MSHIKNVLIFAVLCVLAAALAQVAEDAPQETEWSPDLVKDYEPNWVSCDYTVYPRARCHDCKTRLLCKRVGGLLLDCPNPNRPYCNNGLCSPVPSVECA